MNEILSYHNASRYFVDNASIDELADAFKAANEANIEDDDDSFEAFQKKTGKSFHEYLRQFDDMI